MRRVFGFALVLVACGSSSENNLKSVTPDTGAAGSSADGSAGAAGGSAGTTSSDAGADAFDPHFDCACETHPEIAPENACGPQGGPGTTCAEKGPPTCLRCSEACKVGSPPGGGLAEEWADAGCQLVVGVGSVSSDPSYSWWCCE